MIFNELTKNSAYNVEDLPTRPNGYQFRATIVYDGVEHEGYGKLFCFKNYIPHMESTE